MKRIQSSQPKQGTGKMVPNGVANLSFTSKVLTFETVPRHDQTWIFGFVTVEISKQI